MITEIPIHPYPKKLFLIINEADSSVAYHFHKEADSFKAIYSLPPEDEARTIRTSRGTTVIRFGQVPTNPGTIAHEAFHATYSILDYVGAKLSDDSEECFAYLLDFITQKIHEEASKIQNP